MSGVEHGHRYYDLPFISPLHMKHVFDPVGLVGETPAIRNRSKKIRDDLVTEGLLPALHPPLQSFKTNNRRFSPDYTEAAFTGAGIQPLSSFRNVTEWKKESYPRLQGFAQSPEAHNILGAAITRYYSGISEATTKLEGHGDAVFIATGTEEDGSSDLHRFGVTRQGLAVQHHHEVTSPHHHHKRFLPIELATKLIRWEIPNIANPETKAAILDHLEAERQQNTSERAIDPQTLFFTGQLAVKGVVVSPIVEVFDN